MFRRLAEVVFICLTFLHPRISLVSICGVAGIVLQRALHQGHYSSLPHVSLRCVSFQFHSFPVWHDFDGGRVLVFAKVTRQPHLDCSRYSKCTKYLPVMRNVAFLAVWTLLIGQRLPPPKKRLTTSSQQKESQREKWVILCSSIIFARPLLLYAVLSMIALQVNCHCQMIRPALVPVLAKLSQKAKASTALWTKSTILLRNWMLWNMLADTLHESLAYPGQLYGDEKQPRNKKISQARKGKKKAGAGCPLSYNEYSDK